MTPKEDIDVIIQWITDETYEGKIDIPNLEVFEAQLRGVFRGLHKLKCKHFFADGQCLQGGRCDGNCQRMKNYDKKH